MSKKFSDGRRSVEELYEQYDQLEKSGWVKEEIIVSRAVWKGKKLAQSIFAYRTKKKGKAVWLLSGIHGEEPAGPNAIAEGVEYLIELGEGIPMVVVPLCNPLGYIRKWRYLNQEKYSAEVEGISVGDSDHLLLKLDGSQRPRKEKATNPVADALTSYAIKMSKDYPPFLSIDLHEDDLIHEGYIYSQGKLGVRDPIAKRIVQVLKDSGIPIKDSGKTRFGEDITEGIVGAEKDASIDELLSSEQIYLDGKTVKGPSAKTVIVSETPAGAMDLGERKRAQLEIIRNLKNFI